MSAAWCLQSMQSKAASRTRDCSRAYSTHEQAQGASAACQGQHKKGMARCICTGLNLGHPAVLMSSVSRWCYAACCSPVA